MAIRKQGRPRTLALTDAGRREVDRLANDPAYRRAKAAQIAEDRRLGRRRSGRFSER
ncbi:MAG TPA: hypothetical protein VGJ54_11185 [Streptosporangiaceae bacterium]|jgi:hypothetical protein